MRLARQVYFNFRLQTQVNYLTFMAAKRFVLIWLKLLKSLIVSFAVSMVELIQNATATWRRSRRNGLN